MEWREGGSEGGREGGREGGNGGRKWRVVYKQAKSPSVRNIRL